MKDMTRELNDETTRFGYGNWLLKIQHGDEQLWIEKEKTGSLNDLCFDLFDGDRIFKFDQYR